jgi:vacuolar-type H+-ATPase subunit E/Vma4
MEIIGDEETLKRAILETAGRESAGILAAASTEAEKTLSAAMVQALENKTSRLKAALAEAARRRETMLSAVPLEAARLRAGRLEVLLDSVKEEAAARLASEAVGAGKPALLAALAAQAVRRMEGGKFIVSLGRDDMAAADGLAAEIERRAGRGPLEISVEEYPGLGGGVMVRDGEGRQYWDNSFKARLERFWPVLRGRLLPGGAGAPGERG